MSRIQSGLTAGALATGPMTLVVMVSRWLGLFRTPPPEQIAENAAAEVGLDEIVDEPAFEPVWLVLHAGFGAGCGVGYQLLRPHLPVSPIVGGAAYGLLVWAVNYLGVMPALGLFPPPRQAGPRRTLVMIVAHLVYGVTLAQLVPSGRSRR